MSLLPKHRVHHPLSKNLFCGSPGLGSWLCSCWIDKIVNAEHGTHQGGIPPELRMRTIRNCKAPGQPPSEQGPLQGRRQQRGGKLVNDRCSLAWPRSLGGSGGHPVTAAFLSITGTPVSAQNARLASLPVRERIYRLADSLWEEEMLKLQFEDHFHNFWENWQVGNESIVQIDCQVIRKVVRTGEWWQPL